MLQSSSLTCCGTKNASSAQIQCNNDIFYLSLIAADTVPSVHDRNFQTPIIFNSIKYPEPVRWRSWSFIFIYSSWTFSTPALILSYFNQCSAAEQIERLAPTGKDLPLGDEWACRIRDNLIMSIDSKFNFTDHIMSSEACTDICSVITTWPGPVWFRSVTTVLIRQNCLFWQLLSFGLRFIQRIFEEIYCTV